MQLRSALLAATVLATPFAASAQPVTGLYVGAGAGVNITQQTDIKALATPPFLGGFNTNAGNLNGTTTFASFESLVGGSAADVEAHTRKFLAQGCAGVDLLAYRATEADPLDLVKAARRALGANGSLICAGAVDRPGRIADLAQAGADAFTIGSAAFDGSFSPRKGSLRSQLEDILACV